MTKTFKICIYGTSGTKIFPDVVLPVEPEDLDGGGQTGQDQQEDAKEAGQPLLLHPPSLRECCRLSLLHP